MYRVGSGVLETWNKGVHHIRACKILDMIYLLTVIGLTPDGSSTVRIYIKTIYRTTHSTQTIQRTTQSIQTIHRTTQSTQTIHWTTQFTNLEECGPCPVFASVPWYLPYNWGKSTEKSPFLLYFLFNVDFGHVRVVRPTWSQRFRLSEYFVTAELRTVFRARSAGTLKIHARNKLHITKYKCNEWKICQIL